MRGKDLKPSKVLVRLDRERELRFDLNALVELEAKFGSLNALFGQEMTMGRLRTLLWAGLLHEDETLTERQVGAMMDLSRLQEYAEAVAKAITNALPAPDPNAGTPQET